MFRQTILLRRHLLAECSAVALAALLTYPAVAQVEPPSSPDSPSSEPIDRPTNLQNPSERPTLVETPSSIGRNPFAPYIARARAAHRSGPASVTALHDPNASMLGESILTGPLIEEPTYDDKSRQSALFELATHQGIVRHAHDFLIRIALLPREYGNREKAECVGGGTYSTSRISPTTIDRNPESAEREVHHFTISFDECILTPPEDWFTGQQALHTQEGWARAAYSGMVEILTALEKDDPVEAFVAYDGFTAHAEPHSVVMTGTEQLSLTTNCVLQNREPSHVQATLNEEVSVFYDSFEFGLRDVEDRKSLCRSNPQPVNFFQGTLHHSEYGVVGVNTEAALSHRIDPQTLHLMPIKSGDGAAEETYAGLIAMSTAAGDRVDLQAKPDRPVTPTSSEQAPAAPINVVIKPASTR